MSDFYQAALKLSPDVDISTESLDYLTDKYIIRQVHKVKIGIGYL